jgi:hypothetical protein
MYAGLLLAGTMTFACLAAVLGAALVYVVAAGGAVALVGAAHYWLWGSRGPGEPPGDESEPGG